MGPQHNLEGLARGARMLRTALGPAIGRLLEDPAVVEVMLNPDGRVWIDRLAGGLADTGTRLSAADGERIVRLVAHHVGAEVHARCPRVSAELPETGERFEGLLPPVVAAPAFAIRKPAVAVFTLDDYVAARIMGAADAEVLRAAVAARANILVAGGTSTGKTTLTNALLAEVAKSGDRVVLIEDTRELQCAAPNLVAMRTKDGVAALSDLVRAALRLRPDRMPIDEVRGAEALDLRHHLVAGLDPPLDEQVGHLVGRPVDLRIAQAGVTEHDRGAVGVALRAVVQEEGEVRHGENLLAGCVRGHGPPTENHDRGWAPAQTVRSARR